MSTSSRSQCVCSAGLMVVVIVIPVFAAILIPIINVSFVNQFAPHEYPAKGPFFEGWYIRLTDTDNERSFGFFWGRVLPRDEERISAEYTPSSKPELNQKPTAYIGLFRSDGPTSPMIVAEAFPNEDDITIETHDGSSSSRRSSSLPSPTHFSWSARPFGFFNATPNSTVFSFTVEGISFSGNFTDPVPWDDTGRGPEGWLTHLPYMPIHWFVYSIGTAGTYTWTRPSSGLVLTGNARAHQEKNWGHTFPSGWIWTQAINRTAGASFAGSFGVLSVISFAPSIPAHLFGYRNHKRNLHLDFRPDNSITIRDLKPCEGKATIHVYSALYAVELSMTSPVETFQSCLLAPYAMGFEPSAVETYVASIRITIHKLGLFGYSLIEDQSFHGAAFEFGLDYLCPENPCQGQHG